MADSSQALPDESLDTELEALLVESLNARALAAQIVIDRKRLTDESLTRQERDYLRAAVLRWESENEWLPQMYVAVEEADECESCQSVSTHFLGLYELQQSRKDSTMRRFVLWEPQTLTGDASRLTRAYHTMSRRMPICPRCMWEKGFALRYEGDLKP